MMPKNAFSATVRTGVRSVLAALLFAFVFASGLQAKTILVFPMAGDGVPSQDLSSVNRLFRDALDGRTGGDIVTLADSACSTRDCAVRLTSSAHADRGVYSTFYKLGSKWIFSATIIEADGSSPFSQRLTALSIEDMEAVTLRMADALIQRKTTEQVASVDNISQKETEDEPNRRQSLYRGGVAVGYLFPTGGNSFKYVDSYNEYDVPQIEGYRQMIRLTWLNTWDFHNNLQLGTDIVWNVPTSIGADASLRYLFGRGDITPFVGGGVGLHYVKGDANNDLAEGGKRNSGPALNAQAGLMLFRTYDVNVMLRGQYQVIFNSDVDQGIAADVGVTFGNRGGKSQGGSSSADGFGTWDYIGAGALGILILALVSQ